MAVTGLVKARIEGLLEAAAADGGAGGGMNLQTALRFSGGR